MHIDQEIAETAKRLFKAEKDAKQYADNLVTYTRYRDSALQTAEETREKLVEIAKRVDRPRTIVIGADKAMIRFDGEGGFEVDYDVMYVGDQRPGMGVSE